MGVNYSDYIDENTSKKIDYSKYIAESTSSSTMGTYKNNSYESTLKNNKNKSNILNISNMKGIDLRKTSKSRNMNATAI